MNSFSIRTPGGTEVEINGNKNDTTPCLQKVFTDTKYKTDKSMSETEKVVFRDILLRTIYNTNIAGKGKMSGRDTYIKYELDNEVRRILNLDKQFKGRGVEKNVIPSNIIDIYTRLEILLGLKLSGHTDTLTEASNLIDA